MGFEWAHGSSLLKGIGNSVSAVKHAKRRAPFSIPPIVGIGSNLV